LIKKIDSSREAVKSTGILAALLFLSHSGWLSMNWKQGMQSNSWRWFFGSGIVLFALSHIAYPIMKPLHIGWMTFAFALGWVNTRLLLGIFFFLILTPIGMVMRLLGKDFLDEKIDRSAKSYWARRESVPGNPQNYERLF
jgi:multisubunit Na+/H+ antiporter MnhG subunit